MITLGKRGDAARAAPGAAHGPQPRRDGKLFDTLADRYRDRPGGYTRVLKLRHARRRRRAGLDDRAGRSRGAGEAAAGRREAGEGGREEGRGPRSRRRPREHGRSRRRREAARGAAAGPKTTAKGRKKAAEAPDRSGCRGASRWVWRPRLRRSCSPRLAGFASRRRSDSRAVSPRAGFELPLLDGGNRLARVAARPGRAAELLGDLVQAVRGRDAGDGAAARARSPAPTSSSSRSRSTRRATMSRSSATVSGSTFPIAARPRQARVARPTRAIASPSRT